MNSKTVNGVKCFLFLVGLLGVVNVQAASTLVKVFYTLAAHYDGQGRGQLIADGEKLTEWPEAANDAERRVAA